MPTKTKPHLATKAKFYLILLFSRFVSITLVFVNKTLLSGGSSLNAPLFITWYQCAVSNTKLSALANSKEISKSVPKRIPGDSRGMLRGRPILQRRQDQRTAVPAGAQAGHAAVYRVRSDDHFQQPLPEERWHFVLLHQPVSHHRVQRRSDLQHPR